jgi:hypothetical protein
MVSSLAGMTLVGCSPLDWPLTTTGPALPEIQGGGHAVDALGPVGGDLEHPIQLKCRIAQLFGGSQGRAAPRLALNVGGG